MIHCVLGKVQILYMSSEAFCNLGPETHPVSLHLSSLHRNTGFSHDANMAAEVF